MSSPVVYHEGNEYYYVKSNSIAQAINFLHESFPEQMPSGERCKRYAVLSSFLASKGRHHSKAMSQFFQMRDDDIDLYHQTLADQLPGIYMAAIDAFRASDLGAPFLELIECLKQIDKPFIRAYLDNPELILIMDVHKQILQSPETKIDISSINLDQFAPAFQTSFLYLFKSNLSDPKSANKELNYIQQQFEGDRPEQDMTNGQFLIRTGSRGRLLSTQRHREQERLRKQRIRLLVPNSNRKKRSERQRQIRGRNQKDERERQLKSLQPTEDWKKSYLSMMSPSTISAQLQGQRQHDIFLDPHLDKWMEYRSPGLYQLWPNLKSLAIPIVANSDLGRQQQSSLSNIGNHSSIAPLAQASLSDAAGLPQGSLDIPKATQSLTMTKPQQPQSDGLITSVPTMLTMQPTSPLVPETMNDLDATSQWQQYRHLTKTDAPSQSDTPPLPEVDEFEDTEALLQALSDMPHI